MNVILKNFSSIKAISSKFERKIGDQMRIEGESFEVVFVGSEEEVQFIMQGLKKIRDKKIRNQRRIEKAEDDAFLFRALNEARISVNKNLPEEYAIGISTVKELINL